MELFNSVFNFLSISIRVLKDYTVLGVLTSRFVVLKKEV